MKTEAGQTIKVGYSFWIRVGGPVQYEGYSLYRTRRVVVARMTPTRIRLDFVTSKNGCWRYPHDLFVSKHDAQARAKA